MKIERYGTCRFCGQRELVEINTVIDDETETAGQSMDDEEQADEMATRRCDCPPSREWFAMQKVEPVLKALVGEDAVKNGFAGMASEGQTALIRDICRMCYRGDVQSASLNMMGDTIKIKCDGVIEVERRTAHKSRMSAI